MSLSDTVELCRIAPPRALCVSVVNLDKFFKINMANFFELRHKVASDEIDGLGHVNNLIYLGWFMNAAAGHTAACGMSGGSGCQRGRTRLPTIGVMEETSVCRSASSAASSVNWTGVGVR